MSDDPGSLTRAGGQAPPSSEFLLEPRLEVRIAWAVQRFRMPPATDHRPVQELTDRRPHRPQVGPDAGNQPGEAAEEGPIEVGDLPRPLISRQRKRWRLDHEAGLDRPVDDPFARQEREG